MVSACCLTPLQANVTNVLLLQALCHPLFSKFGRAPLVVADTVGRAEAHLPHPSRRQGWTSVAGTGAGSMRVTVGLSHVQRSWSYELFFDLQA